VDAEVHGADVGAIVHLQPAVVLALQRDAQALAIEGGEPLDPLGEKDDAADGFDGHGPDDAFHSPGELGSFFVPGSSLFPALLLASLLGAAVACGPAPGPTSDAGEQPPDAGEFIDAGDAPDASGFEDAGAPPDAGPGTDGGWPAPETVLHSGPSGSVPTADVTFTFGANDPRHGFECALGQGAFSGCESPHALQALPDGYHWFRVRAVAPDGEVDPTPASRGFTVDTVPPETLLTLAPTTEGSSVTATFAFTVDGPPQAGLKFECRLDTAAFSSCTSPRHYSGLSPGAHTFEVRATDVAGNVDPTPPSHAWNVAAPSATTVHVMAANLTSGNAQSYSAGHGIRIFQGLSPDIVLIQEFNHGTNTAAELRAFVDAAFGPQFFFSRQQGVQLPNGIISRYPILDSGIWDDPLTENREFSWARIDVPGPVDLWAVSVHLLTSSPSARNSEAAALVAEISAHVPAGDFLVVGGDFNTDARGEACITTLSQVLVTSGPGGEWPVDQAGNDSTNTSRTKPYDWLLADPDLAARRTPLVIGSVTHPDGLVFDSRVYTPLAEVAPVQAGDSGGLNMQHMAVSRAFLLPP
jgi:endonuclease/exonuclease/phosphatase family metal-dependent hydrolase